MDKIKQFRKELLSKVTRMEAMETELGLQINHLSIITEPDSDQVEINFELTSLSGKTLPQDVYINFAFYDDEGTITCKDSIYIISKKFKGFCIESCFCNINTKARDIARIIVYPSEG